MFGLEGSGFVVCLGLILFLIGLVMFYVRQRFADQEAKLNQVISIIPVMTQQIQLHEQELHPNMFHKDAPTTESNPLGTIQEEDSKIDVSSSDESDDESESEPESDDEEEDDDAPRARQLSRPRNRPRRGQPPASDPEPVDPLRAPARSRPPNA